MLVQRLVEYARENSDSAPFHREREFVWRLDLYSDGRPARLTGIREPDAKGKLRGQRHTTPAVTRTVGVAPQLGADDIQYVFGWGDDTTKPERVAQCHEHFVSLISAWAGQADDDHAALSVREFYRQQDYIRWERPADYGAKDGVLIAVDEQLIIKRSSLVRFWADEVIRRKGGKNGGFGLCLACGTESPLVDSIPGTVPKRLVPGAGNDVALVSVNAQVFGYGLTTGLQHTPICFTCGNAVSVALTHLLSSEHATKLPGQDSVMVWWVLGASPNDIFDVMPRNADPGAVSRLLKELWSGELDRAAELAEQWDSQERFCSLSLGGNSSRIMVREWIDMPLAAVARNLGRWYDHMRIASGWHDEPVSHGLWHLVLATGRWESGGDGAPGRYAEIGAKSGRRPEHIQRDLLARALRGVPLPRSVLHHVLRRIASDGHVDAPRAGLLRLALCHPRDKEPRVSPGLDEESHDTAYVYGRVFARLEEIQYLAHGKEVNTTFGDRFLAGAIGNPTPAVMAGRKLASAWLNKIRRNPKTSRALRRLREDLDQLLHLVDHTAPLTGYLPPEQQARFVLGYHQQRAHDTQQRRARKAADGDDPERGDDGGPDENA
ncbi:type I-C CRISPR-associated protein Cas8c/Csd1 [Saccharopolyspora phatthalungensis]|uniref:CRISPR-associated protein Csd1 n=1 Tax=Saccharopolyspora phatthalungensis TaxID=664693 RepID=A0A840Q774_9PSEU|nr:type I-C CRISPR-associated protein Cas8c/Csd1 [Saccharopolyspora phatthalungensis]MBB5156524.1 CRISPR-associated protein Csd1 [Saccharopolyspora phatthalungensis]